MEESAEESKTSKTSQSEEQVKKATETSLTHNDLVEAKQEIKEDLETYFTEMLNRVEKWSSEKFSHAEKELAKISERGLYTDLNTLNDIAKQLNKLESELILNQQEIELFLNERLELEQRNGELFVYQQSMMKLNKLHHSIGTALSLVQNQRYSFDELTSMMRRKHESHF